MNSAIEMQDKLDLITPKTMADYEAALFDTRGKWVRAVVYLQEIISISEEAPEPSELGLKGSQADRYEEMVSKVLKLSTDALKPAQ